MRRPTGNSQINKKQAEETIKAVKDVSKKVVGGVKYVSKAIKTKVLKAFKR